MDYFIHLFINFEIYVIVALSLNLVVGYSGMLTLAHAAFYAVGGYVYALLALILGWGFLQAVLAAILIACVLSLTVSLPSWRLKGDFFVLASLAVLTLLYSFINNWSDPNAPIGSWSNLTNGSFGIAGIPKAKIMGFRLNSSWFFWLATFTTLFCTLVIRQLTSSPWGRLLASMREDELASRSLGKNTRLLKVQVFAISCSLVAIAGSLYAVHISYLDPTSASLNESILMLSMVIIGGAGNFRGPIVGAAILTALPELLQFLDLPVALAANLRFAIYGMLLVLMMHFRPQGICGSYRST